MTTITESLLKLGGIPPGLATLASQADKPIMAQLTAKLSAGDAPLILLTQFIELINAIEAPLTLLLKVRREDEECGTPIEYHKKISLRLEIRLESTQLFYNTIITWSSSSSDSAKASALLSGALLKVGIYENIVQAVFNACRTAIIASPLQGAEADKVLFAMLQQLLNNCKGWVDSNPHNWSKDVSRVQASVSAPITRAAMALQKNPAIPPPGPNSMPVPPPKEKNPEGPFEMAVAWALNTKDMLPKQAFEKFVDILEKGWIYSDKQGLPFKSYFVDFKQPSVDDAWHNKEYQPTYFKVKLGIQDGLGPHNIKFCGDLMSYAGSAFSLRKQRIGTLDEDKKFATFYNEIIAQSHAKFLNGEVIIFESSGMQTSVVILALNGRTKMQLSEHLQKCLNQIDNVDELHNYLRPKVVAPPTTPDTIDIPTAAGPQPVVIQDVLTIKDRIDTLFGTPGNTLNLALPEPSFLNLDKHIQTFKDFCTAHPMIENLALIIGGVGLFAVSGGIAYKLARMRFGDYHEGKGYMFKDILVKVTATAGTLLLLGSLVSDAKELFATAKQFQWLSQLVEPKKGEKDCRTYWDTGKCNRQPNCEYDHIHTKSGVDATREDEDDETEDAVFKRFDFIAKLQANKGKIALVMSAAAGIVVGCALAYYRPSIKKLINQATKKVKFEDDKVEQARQLYLDATGQQISKKKAEELVKKFPGKRKLRHEIIKRTRIHEGNDIDIPYNYGQTIERYDMPAIHPLDDDSSSTEEGEISSDDETNDEAAHEPKQNFNRARDTKMGYGKDVFTLTEAQLKGLQKARKTGGDEGVKNYYDALAAEKEEKIAKTLPNVDIRQMLLIYERRWPKRSPNEPGNYHRLGCPICEYDREVNDEKNLSQEAAVFHVTSHIADKHAPFLSVLRVFQPKNAFYKPAMGEIRTEFLSQFAARGATDREMATQIRRFNTLVTHTPGMVHSDNIKGMRRVLFPEEAEPQKKQEKAASEEEDAKKAAPATNTVQALMRANREAVARYAAEHNMSYDEAVREIRKKRNQEVRNQTTASSSTASTQKHEGAGFDWDFEMIECLYQLLPNNEGAIPQNPKKDNVKKEKQSPVPKNACAASKRRQRCLDEKCAKVHKWDGMKDLILCRKKDCADKTCPFVHKTNEGKQFNECMIMSMSDSSVLPVFRNDTGVTEDNRMYNATYVKIAQKQYLLTPVWDVTKLGNGFLHLEYPPIRNGATEQLDKRTGFHPIDWTINKEEKIAYCEVNAKGRITLPPQYKAKELAVAPTTRFSVHFVGVVEGGRRYKVGSCEAYLKDGELFHTVNTTGGDCGSSLVSGERIVGIHWKDGAALAVTRSFMSKLSEN